MLVKDFFQTIKEEFDFIKFKKINFCKDVTIGMLQNRMYNVVDYNNYKIYSTYKIKVLSIDKKDIYNSRIEIIEVLKIDGISPLI